MSATRDFALALCAFDSISAELDQNLGPPSSASASDASGFNGDYMVPANRLSLLGLWSNQQGNGFYIACRARDVVLS
jgi:hypothetical protein